MHQHQRMTEAYASYIIPSWKHKISLCGRKKVFEQEFEDLNIIVLMPNATQDHVQLMIVACL